MESLALWLRQFQNEEERRTAYDFIKRRLLFISDAEMNHLVELSFPVFIRPHLIRATAAEIRVAASRVKLVTQSLSYKTRLRKTLVLGLSDGARTDRFRRANAPWISNEQIWHAYEVSESKAADLARKLGADIAKLKRAHRGPDETDATFNTVVLLDDFTASGTSYLRQEPNGLWEGKIPKILRLLEDDQGLGTLIAKDNVAVIVVIYVAAPQAVEHIGNLIKKLDFSHGTLRLEVVHQLSESTRLSRPRDSAILTVAETEDYFDSEADDENAAVGGTSFQLGYADCRLPVVLTHNTPNNSIFLLWAEDMHKIHGLFPRVSRHRKFE